MEVYLTSAKSSHTLLVYSFRKSSKRYRRKQWKWEKGPLILIRTKLLHMCIQKEKGHDNRWNLKYNCHVCLDNKLYKKKADRQLKKSMALLNIHSHPSPVHEMQDICHLLLIVFFYYCFPIDTSVSDLHYPFQSDENRIDWGVYMKACQSIWAIIMHLIMLQFVQF